MKRIHPILIPLAVVILLIAKPAQADIVLSDWLAPPRYDTGASFDSSGAKPAAQVFAPGDETASIVTNSAPSVIQVDIVSPPDDPTVLPAPAVPEPSTWAMLLIGFAGVGFIAYRRRNRTVALAA